MITSAADTSSGTLVNLSDVASHDAAADVLTDAFPHADPASFIIHLCEGSTALALVPTRS